MAHNGRTFRVSQINNNTYKISFHTRMGENSFTVLLSEAFPDAAPRLFCEARYSHPWLDQNGNVVGLGLLNRWSAHSSDLGSVVSAAAMQFVASPPTLKAQPTQPPQPQFAPVQKLQASQSQPAPAVSRPPPSYEQHQVKRQTSVMDMRTTKFSIPRKIVQVDSLSAERKREMVAEPKLMEEFAYRECASGLREMRHAQQNEILRVAKANLAKKEDMLRADKEIQALREEIDTLSTYFGEIKARQDKQLQKFSTPRLLRELKAEIEKSDAKTNELKDKFDEGELAPVAFTKKYVKERSIFHLLHIKKEKMRLFEQSM